MQRRSSCNHFSRSFLLWARAVYLSSPAAARGATCRSPPEEGTDRDHRLIYETMKLFVERDNGQAWTVGGGAGRGGHVTPRVTLAGKTGSGQVTGGGRESKSSGQFVVARRKINGSLV